MKRRKFVKIGTAAVVGASLVPEPLRKNLYAGDEIPQAVWVTNGEPALLAKAGLEALGGMKAFISKGDVVAIKPNIGWDRAPQFAANTNPDLVAELVKQCFDAGAKTVKVFDRTCNNARRCYSNSQIEDKAAAAGAEVIQVRKSRFSNIKIENGSIIKEWPVYNEYLEADKKINVPIAKHHSLSSVSLGLKNLMGVMGGNRGSIHAYFESKLADINSAILPDLTIVDAYRILTANGPVGGNLAHVKNTKTLIASRCTVAADFLALQLFGHRIDDVRHIKEAQNRGLNKFDLNNLRIRKVELS